MTAVLRDQHMARSATALFAVAVSRRVIFSFGFLPVLPAAVPIAGFGDPTLPKKAELHAKKLGRSAVSDVRFLRRGKPVAHPEQRFSSS